jgi:hypothetical protein
MSSTYFIHVIRPKENLDHIARKYYGDSSLSARLADYNGILKPDQIYPNQVLEIPSLAELQPHAVQKPGGALEFCPPHGLKEIVGVFGNIYDYLKEDGTLDERWIKDQITQSTLPFTVPLAWNPSILINRITCHRKTAGLFQKIFGEIRSHGWDREIQSFGACYNYRSKRFSNKLSTHCWGIAIDLNPNSNITGMDGDMHWGIIRIFDKYGFRWGGHWPGYLKDPMHFQFCTGY